MLVLQASAQLQTAAVLWFVNTEFCNVGSYFYVCPPHCLSSYPVSYVFIPCLVFHAALESTYKNYCHT
jgi:hypothetical protein